jgi:hypothetical protein
LPATLNRTGAALRRWQLVASCPCPPPPPRWWGRKNTAVHPPPPAAAGCPWPPPAKRETNGAVSLHRQLVRCPRSGTSSWVCVCTRLTAMQKLRIVTRDFGWGIAHGGRYATPAEFPPLDGSPYRELRVRRWGLGFGYRSRTILCRLLHRCKVADVFHLRRGQQPALHRRVLGALPPHLQ